MGPGQTVLPDWLIFLQQITLNSFYYAYVGVVQPFGLPSYFLLAKPSVLLKVFVRLQAIKKSLSNPVKMRHRSDSTARPVPISVARHDVFYVKTAI